QFEILKSGMPLSGKSGSLSLVILFWISFFHLLFLTTALLLHFFQKHVKDFRTNVNQLFRNKVSIKFYIKRYCSGSLKIFRYPDQCSCRYIHVYGKRLMKKEI